MKIWIIEIHNTFEETLFLTNESNLTTDKTRARQFNNLIELDRVLKSLGYVLNELDYFIRVKELFTGKDYEKN